MPGIDPEIVTHKLIIYEGVKPVKQKKRNFGPETDKIIEEEVQKLLDAGFIEECLYLEWLANVVLVKKPQPGKWRICIDFTSLNKCCPKDSYPLPKIDQLVDSTVGYALLSCMDTFFGYHQIFIDLADKEKGAFICSAGVFNYIMMPFGLMNVGAAYQRLMDKIFKDQMGKNLELYVDDSIVKSKTKEEMIIDL